MTAALNANNFPIENVQTLTFDGLYNNGNSGTGTVTVNWNNGQDQVLTLTGSCTIAFTAPLGVGTFRLKTVMGGSGSYTITWPTEGQSAGNVAWMSKTVAQPTAAVGSWDLFNFFYDGSAYLGSSGPKIFLRSQSQHDRNKYWRSCSHGFLFFWRI